MATGESLVYHGREGTGFAQVFGQAGDPLQAYYNRQVSLDRKAKEEAAAAAMAKKERDKQMWNLMNVDPEKAFAPFNQQVLDSADQHRKWIGDYFEQGGDPDDPQFQRRVKAGWDAVNHKARQSNYVKDTIDQTMKGIEANPYMMAEYYYPKMFDQYMDPYGNVKPVEEIDYEGIRNITVDDPMGFNNVKYQKDFNSDLKTNVYNFQKDKNVNGGLEMTNIDTKISGGLYTYNPEKGDVERDEEGNPILNVTPEYQNSYMANEHAKRYFEKKAALEGTDVNTLLRQNLTGKVPLDRDVKRTFSREPLGPWMYGQKEEKRRQAAFDREDKLNAIANPIQTDGTVSPIAKSAIGGLRGAKYLDGNIVDIDIVPGTNTPGQFKFGGRNVSNSPSNRIVFTVKTSDRGQPQLQEIDLDSPEARDFLNGLYNTSPAETEKFSSGQITTYTGRPWTSTSPGVNTAERKKFAAEQENFLVDKVMNAGVDEDLTENFEGKTYQGKPIVSVRKIETDSGIFGFGQKTAIEVKTMSADGLNEEFKNITDKEEIRKILKGGTIKANTFKDKSGKSWTREQLLKQYSEEDLQWAIDNGILE